MVQQTRLATPEHFRIAVPEAVLADLRDRLARTRWPRSGADAGWSLGASLPYLRKVCDHWLNRYDWRSWEARLNGMLQYHVPVGGMRIHVLVEPGSGPEPMPLIMTHGWPGSPVELLEMVEPLAHPERFGGSTDDAFTVVLPSLPGVGFSDSPPDGPQHPRDTAALWARLMPSLGFDRYIAHAGDSGGMVNSWLGFDRPPELAGLHLNGGLINAGWTLEASPPTPEEADYLERRLARAAGETAYQHLHGTKPLTLGYGLADSPIGLAAWVLEKFRGWAAPAPDGEPPFDMDHLITNLMFYWLGDAQAASWVYRYIWDGSGYQLPAGKRIETPTAFFLSQNDIGVPPPDSWLARTYAVENVTRIERGGHFPAMENTQALVEDLRAFRRRLR